MVISCTHGDFTVGMVDWGTSLFSRTLESWFNKGNHPQMAELFRLVKYYHLPIYIYITHWKNPVHDGGMIMSHMFAPCFGGLPIRCFSTVTTAWCGFGRFKYAMKMGKLERSHVATKPWNHGSDSGRYPNISLISG